MTTTAAPGRRTPIIDRIARWALDPDGDIYGDERERLHWYEGIAAAAGIQWLAVPWAAAVMVWVGGRPAVAPLVTVLAALYLPCLLCQAYVQRRKVETTPRSWSPKKIIVTVLGILPSIVFLLGTVDAMTGNSAALRGASIGVVIGSGLVTLWLARKTQLRRRREALVLPDAD